MLQLSKLRQDCPHCTLHIASRGLWQVDVILKKISSRRLVMDGYNTNNKFSGPSKIYLRMMEFCSSHLVCEPPSRLVWLLSFNLLISLIIICASTSQVPVTGYVSKILNSSLKSSWTVKQFWPPSTVQRWTQVNLLVEHRSLYATFGKVHGRFLDQADK